MSDPKSHDGDSITALKAHIAELEGRIAEQERQHNLMIRSLFHDIKNPLAVTLGSLQVAKLVAGKDLSPKALRLLESAAEGGKIQLAMIHNLADQIKIEMGELTLLVEQFSPGAIVNRLFDRFAQAEPAKFFSYNSKDQEASVRGDSQAFERAVGNLLDHCMRHTRRGGKIKGEAGLDKSGNFWNLSVTDDGELLGADQFDSIFDRRNVGSSKALGARRDVGMGLSYARMAIRAMGGDLIAVESGDVGAKFILTMICRK